MNVEIIQDRVIICNNVRNSATIEVNNERSKANINERNIYIFHFVNTSKEINIREIITKVENTRQKYKIPIVSITDFYLYLRKIRKNANKDFVKSSRLRSKGDIIKSLRKRDSFEKFERILQSIENIKSDYKKINVLLEEKNLELLTNTKIMVSYHLDNNIKQLLPGFNVSLNNIDVTMIPKSGLILRVTIQNVPILDIKTLSGGQRALLGFALLMAFLKYSPSPIYILDEIDAALDLEHTHKISRSLREDFSGSQFIIISLHEKMFTNADSIYLTFIFEGRSQIKKFISE